MSARDVLVTGIGLLLPGCRSRTEFSAQLEAGSCQLMLEPDPVGGPRRRPVGRIRDFDATAHLGAFPERFYNRCPRESQLYLASVALACRDADLDLRAEGGERVGLFAGTSRSGFDYWHQRATAQAHRDPAELYGTNELVYATPGQALGVAAALWGIRGPTFTFNCSCSSGAVAIGHALQQLASGEIDVAVASGYESALTGPIYGMYEAAGLLTEEYLDVTRAVRPYVEHSGNAFGEGAVSLLLETSEHAASRRARPLARLSGFGYGNTGRHPTHVEKDGARLAEVARDVLERAGISALEIALVVGHGNGVPASDECEIAFMRRLFGAETRSVPLISVKPLYGHTLGAASAVNVAAAVSMLARGRGVLTLNTVDGPPDLNFGANTALVPGRNAALALSLGLGGHNCVVLIHAAPNPAAAASWEEAHARHRVPQRQS